jgi:hypothetical protein
MVLILVTVRTSDLTQNITLWNISVVGFLDCREEEGIELQVLSSKQSSETPPVGCSSRNSYIEPQQGAGTDADSINSSEYPAEEVTFKNGSSTIGELSVAV